MSEYWKSGTNYWCKHCKTYVRDTKLERANHDSTLKHQNAVKRALTALHRGHEREAADSERAKREIARLNGVAYTPEAGRPDDKPTAGGRGGPEKATPAQRQRQMEQLAELGVSIPDTFRGGLALAGDWTVTSTRVIPDPEADDDSKDKAAATAVGVRKRELEKTEEELEEEEAVKGLFKKQRQWGRDSKTMPVDGDAELDALLSGTLAPSLKKEDSPDDVPAKEAATREPQVPGEKQSLAIKREDSDGAAQDGSVAPRDAEKEKGDAAPEAPAVSFKKRKPKAIRQK